MIVLKNITRTNSCIVCDAYVEDCKQAVHLSFDESKLVLGSYTLPNDYEWCINHIMHAKKYLVSIAGKPIESQTHTIMWY